MKFTYQAKKRDGSAVRGDIDAESLTNARQQLKRDGLFVLAIDAQRTSISGSATGWFGRGQGIRKGDLMVIMSQLTIMLQSGVDLAEALQNVSQQAIRPSLKTILEAVHSDVSSGLSFSEALRKHPHAFDETFVAGVSAGEFAGEITPVLERLTQMIRSDLKLRSSILSMLMYPMVLCNVTLLVVVALIFFVLPQFAKVFDDLGKPAPPLTRLLLGSGAFMQSYGIELLIAVAAAGITIFVFRKSDRFLRFIDRSVLNLFVVRHASRALITGRSLRLLGTMVLSGVPLVDGIRLCRATSKNRFFRDLFERVEHDVMHGEGIGKPMLAATFLPAGAAQMVATAERSGRLGSVLQSIGEYFEDSGEQRLRDLVKFLEPAVIVFLGVIVAVVVLSVLLPLLDVTTASH